MLKLSLKDRPLLSNILSSIIYGLLVLGGGAVLAYLKVNYPDWFTIVLWALVGAALTSVIVTAFVVWKRLPKPTPQVTPENLETNIRAWLDFFRFAVQRTINAEAFFCLAAAPEGNDPLLISRLRELDRYVLVEALIKISPDDKTLLDSLSPEERGIFAGRLSVELARTTINFSMNLKDNFINLQRRVPITPDLSESTFMARVEEVLNARLQVLRTLELMLLDAKEKHPALSP